MPTKFGELMKLSSTDRKVLDLYDEYVSGPRNLQLEAETITHILTKNLDRIETGSRDRTKTWSASAAGSCDRKQQFDFLGMPSNRGGADRENIFLNGDYLHLRYQVAGLISGWLFDAEVPLFWDGKIRGTMDGDLSWGEVLEIKSINDRGFARVSEFGPKEDHKDQATAYMICTGYKATRFIYENKNDNRNREFYFPYEPERAERLQDQWDRLNTLTDKRELAPMLRDCRHHRGFDWRWCGFSQICEDAKWPKTKVRLVK